MLTVRDVIHRTFLDDDHAAEGTTELGAHGGVGYWGVTVLGWLGEFDVHGFGEASEFDNVGGEYALLITLDKVRPRLRQVQAVSVKNKGHVLGAGFGDDAGTSFLHERVAAEAGAYNDDVEAGKHVDDRGGDGVGGFRGGGGKEGGKGGDFVGLAHEGVNH